MEVRQLEYVVMIADTKNFTRAAERCHTAQSALSHQVARLESQLGTRLFERTSRSVRLTEAGEALLPFARRILNDIADAQNQLCQVGARARGRVRVGVTQTAVRSLDVLRVISEYERECPDCEVSVVVDPGQDPVTSLSSGDLDAVFAASDFISVPDGIHLSVLRRAEPLVAVVAEDHELAGKETVTLEELVVSGRFIGSHTDPILRGRLEHLFRTAGLAPKRAMEVGSVCEILWHVSNGDGVAIVPGVFAQNVTNQPTPPSGISVVGLSAPDATLDLGLFRRSSPTPPVAMFLDHFAARDRGSCR